MSKVNKELNNIKRDWAMALIFIIIAFVGAVLGYHIIEKWNYSNCFYVTFMVMTSSGFTDMPSMDSAGKIFSTGLTVVGILIFAYITTCFVGTMVFIYKNNFTSRRIMERNIKMLDGHFIIGGYGKIGRTIARKLSDKFGNKIVIVDINELKIDMAEADGYLTIKGDVKNKATLENAGIGKASYLLLTLDLDADNMIGIAIAKKLNRSVKVISKVSDDASKLIAESMAHLGADFVIDPYEAGACCMTEVIREYF